MASEKTLQCPCGKKYASPDEYKLVFVKKDQCEIDILCANPACHLKELGYVKFGIDKARNKAYIEIASFYPPYVTWNATRLSKEDALKLLEQHLRYIVEKRIDWRKIMMEMPDNCITQITVREVEEK